MANKKPEQKPVESLLDRVRNLGEPFSAPEQDIPEKTAPATKSEISLIVKEKKFWRGTKIYAVKHGKKRTVLNCSRNGLEKVSNLLLAPLQDKLLFTAEKPKQGLRDIYVVGINGSNLERITYKGEAVYLTKPDDLRWTGPATFSYAAPEFTSQTYSLACDDSQPHVLAIILGSMNGVSRVYAGYYDKNGELKPEHFTEEQVEEHFSRIYDICEGWINRYKRVLAKMDNAIERAKKRAKQEKFELEKRRLESGIQDLQGFREQIQAGTFNQTAELYEQFKKIPKIPDNISILRASIPLFGRNASTIEEDVQAYIDSVLK